ncbi:MAG: FAD-NAD(P)-binding protein [Rhodobacterales bacterium]|nr:MAG: FAD-NAD(P)-binding protein [Rhodobacterales bacterium]
MGWNQCVQSAGGIMPAKTLAAFRNVAIVGTGPTGLYTLHHLLQRGQKLTATLFEAAPLAGVGSPYSPETTQASMLANIASIEIPPLGETYLDWLRRQPDAMLQVYGVNATTLHERQFLPRLLLGGWFRDALERMIREANAQGHRIALREAARVLDVEPVGAEYRVTFAAPSGTESLLFTHVVLATGHDWPDDPDHQDRHFVSPWSGLIEAKVPAQPVGILGTSLSGIDAAMAVACQHGHFVEGEDTTYHPNPGSEGLKITLMSRNGLIPEADFWCALPYRPLVHVTEAALAQAQAAGAEGLIDRLWHLFKLELSEADPAYARAISLADLTPEAFASAYFAPRLAADPFVWAAENLAEVQRNTAQRRTVEWRYAILRMHEPMETLVASFNDRDRSRFEALQRVFVDNYAAVPPQSIRRMLALHRAGILTVLSLGDDYSLTHADGKTLVLAETGQEQTFAVYVDARGQRPLGLSDLPFPNLRAALGEGDGPVPISSSFALSEPHLAGIYLPAAPYLLSRLPFVQGIVSSCDLGQEVARAIIPDAPEKLA